MNKVDNKVDGIWLHEGDFVRMVPEGNQIEEFAYVGPAIATLGRIPLTKGIRPGETFISYGVNFDNTNEKGKVFIRRPSTRPAYTGGLALFNDILVIKPEDVPAKLIFPFCGLMQ